MTAKKRNTGLGKGLEALFGEIDSAENKKSSGAAGAKEISINDIKPNASQPRKNFDEDAIKDLAASISEHGVIQPIIVRPSGKGYEIIAGERRWRASREAGLKNVPCLVRELTDEEMMLFAIIENMQREDLNPIEEAEGLDNMISTYGMTQEQISRSVGKSRPYITNALRLLKLPDEVKEMISKGKLTGGHGRAILSAGSKKDQIELAKKIAKDGMSVRGAEALAGGGTKKRHKGKRAEKNANVLAIETELKERLGTKVTLNMNGRKGKIEIEYYSRDELDRLIDILRTV